VEVTRTLAFAGGWRERRRHHKDMVETLQYLSHVPAWGYMSLNDATIIGGGFEEGWKSANITCQPQKLVRSLAHKDLVAVPSSYRTHAFIPKPKSMHVPMRPRVQVLSAVGPASI